MLYFTLGMIFGFVAGCSLKDLILSKTNQYCKSHQIKTDEKLEVKQYKTSMSTENTTNISNSNIKEFNLCSIQTLFDKYQVEIIGVNSFSILLDKLERVTYIETIKQFSSSVKTSEDLFNLIEKGETINEIIHLDNCVNKIMISENNINQLLMQNNINQTSACTLEEKVQLLISFYVSKGLKQFQKTMGPSLEQFMSNYKDKKNVSFLFDGIMNNINKALSYLS